MNEAERRSCRSCGSRLAADNQSTVCTPCQAAGRVEEPNLPDHLGPDFWDDPAMRSALAARHMGRVIRAYRVHPHFGRRSLSQEKVASWAGLTQGWVSQIENGPPINQLDRLVFWAELLRIPEDLLWFELPGSEPRQSIGRKSPREGPGLAAWPGDGSLQESSLAAERAAALGVDLWDLLDALEATKVSETSLHVPEEACSRLDARYGELPPTVLLPELRRQMHHVVAWLKESQPVAYRQRLSALAGRLAGLRAWLYFDMAEMDAAEAWFAAGVRAALEAEDHDLSGYLLGAHSLVPVDRGDYIAARQLVDGGQEFVKRGRQTTRAWLDIIEARVLAGSGAARESDAACRRAEKRSPATTVAERRHGMDFTAGGDLDLAYYQGLSHLLLGRDQPAVKAFATMVDVLPAARIKARSILMLSHAIACAGAGELDRAAARGSEALTVAGDQPIRRTWQRAEELRRLLDPIEDSAAFGEFDERLGAYAGRLERTLGVPPA